MPSKKVVVFAPHPDDAEFFAGGLIAKLRSEGYELLIVTATDGRCGTYHIEPEKLALMRKMEAENAARLCGASIRFLGYRDYELNQSPPGELTEKVMRIIREEKPDIVIAEDAFCKNEVHPDHRALATAVSDAINFSQYPNVFPQHRMKNLASWFVVEKFYYTDDPARMNKIVDITPYIEQKLAGMMAHESQVDFMVEDVMRQAGMAGGDLNIITGMQTEPIDPQAAIRMALLAQAAELGKRVNAAYAEGYHYTRFHPFVEKLINP